MQPPLVFFLDLDGVLIRYSFDCFRNGSDMEVLPGTLEKLAEWRSKGYQIILTTGRGLSRDMTVAQLAKAGIIYDQLIMGIGGGRRILVNDTKPDGYITAVAYPLPRDEGISSISE